MDHNELSQAVPDADEAEIISVLDHHRLGNAATAMPIPFTVDVVGSTSTLVAELCRNRGLEPPKGLAGMLLSGLLSDTLLFRSPTATDRDRDIAEWLTKLSDTDIDIYGDELLRAAPGIVNREVADILDADRKSYTMGTHSVSIAQVEVAGLETLPSRREELLVAMADRKDRENLSLMALMVTDVVTGKSHLLVRGEKWIITALPFAWLSEGVYDIEDMVSRKKQLVPTLHTLFENA